MKNVLVIYFSQTGQLYDIIDNITASLQGEDITITTYKIALEEPFPFPWDNDSFYGAFPETYLQIPKKVAPPTNPEIFDKQYDLIIFGYQVWFLTPSNPIVSFLKTPWAKKVFANTPVVTVSATRNMWVQAQEKLKGYLRDFNATLVGNIALVDRNINHVSVVTIVHWMFGGKKTKFLGIFPKPGVADKEIKEANKFGFPIKEALLNGDFSTLQTSLLAQGAVHIKPFLVQIDKTGNMIFSKWAHLIIKKKETRKKWTTIFKYYLLIAIWLVSPIVFIVFLIRYPFNQKRIKQDRAYYSSVEDNYS